MNIFFNNTRQFNFNMICRVFFLFVAFSYSIFAGSTIAEGVNLIEIKQYKKAKQFFEKIIKNNEKNDSALYYLGYTYLIQNDHDNAIKYLEKAVDINKKHASYHLRLGQALGQKAQNSNPFKQAWLAPKVLKEFEKSVELDPELLEGHVALCNFYLRAPSIVGGDVKKAKIKAKKVITLDEFQGNFIFANIYNREKQIDSAGIYYEIAEKSFIDSTHHYGFFNNYGYFLISIREYDLAIEKFQKQIKLAPDVANTHDSMGDAYKAAGKLQLALQAYKKAIDLDPDFEASKKNYKELKKKLN